jgi:aerobic-type carbon monoxide dehydrogenase small subunit (CoxS/CutS family)
MPTPLAINLLVNGDLETVSVADDTEPLLYVLRNQLDQVGPKFGCGVAQCGVCTVLINGVVKRSCVTAMNTLHNGDAVVTLDGLGPPQSPHPLQKAFLDHQAGQCAYCINGIIMCAYQWLQSRLSSGNHAVPTDDEVKDFLSGVGQTPPFVYICRCGAHLRMIRAIQQASQEMQ